MYYPCRLFQYGSKFAWYYLEQQRRNPVNIEKLKNLESTLSATRKSKLLSDDSVYLSYLINVVTKE